MTTHLLFLLGLTLNCTVVMCMYNFSIRMPNVHPTKNDQYMYHAQPVWDNATYYITSFEPLASMKLVHHMLVYGCKDAVELQAGSAFCKSGKVLFYAWARNAPKLDLPDGVGFKIGKDSDVRYILLQVHYVSSSEGEHGDRSGVNFYLTSDKLNKLAGVFILGTGGKMDPGTNEYFEVACKYGADDDDNVISLHPFAFRTHTHHHGLFVSGYQVQESSSSVQNWKIIGKKNPQLPQFFYPVEDNTLVIKKGDILAARCTMQNNENRTVYIGGTSNDEMCNFYMMYYVDGEKLSKQSSCWSAGPPQYYWAIDNSLNNIPRNASGP